MAFPTGPQPDSDASAWDWLQFVDPKFASMLTPAAQERLATISAGTEPTVGDLAWAKMMGRDLAQTALYSQGSPLEREHLFVGSERMRSPDAWKHETIHALSGMVPGDPRSWNEILGSEGQRRSEMWYFDGPAEGLREEAAWATHSGAEGMVGMLDRYQFDPWRVPLPYRELFQNILTPGAWERPPIPELDPKYVGSRSDLVPPPAAQDLMLESEKIQLPPPPQERTTRPKPKRPSRRKGSQRTNIRPI